ncbi:MAG: DNA-binding protein [Lachnospiraceae bacterium]|nr:DNA-binding protein [Lachnospiraceae bacterium]
MKKDSDERILEFIELSRLYDRYGGLLNEKSKKIVESYVIYDMSLGETASETGLSRQGVRDVLIRSHEKLKKIDEVLDLVEGFDLINESVDKIEEVLFGSKKNIADEDLLSTGNNKELNDLSDTDISEIKESIEEIRKIIS